MRAGGWREFCAFLQVPKARCHSKQPPLETYDEVPPYTHPILSPPKNEVQSWENNTDLPHWEPTTSEGTCLTLLSGAVTRDTDTGYSCRALKVLHPLSHRLGEIKIRGATGVRLKPQLPVCLITCHKGYSWCGMQGKRQASLQTPTRTSLAGFMTGQDKR